MNIPHQRIFELVGPIRYSIPTSCLRDGQNVPWSEFRLQWPRGPDLDHEDGEITKFHRRIRKDPLGRSEIFLSIADPLPLCDHISALSQPKTTLVASERISLRLGLYCNSFPEKKSFQINVHQSDDNSSNSEPHNIKPPHSSKESFEIR